MSSRPWAAVTRARTRQARAQACAPSRAPSHAQTAAPARTWVEPLERRLMLAATVVARHVFYNNSAFDGRTAGAAAADDAAVAADKRVLLPGEAATFAHYTAYSRGINGLMIDIAGLPTVKTKAGKGPTRFDFEFLYADTTESEPAPRPRTVTTRRGAGTGGSDRVTLVWADGAVRNRWLQVVVRPTFATGLAARDDFYVGNRVAETGDDPAAALVTAADVLATRNAISRAPAAPDSRYDHNRDGRVNGLDVEVARRNRASRGIGLLAVPPTPVPKLDRLRLANDTGDESDDGITSDVRVRAGVDDEYLAQLLAGFDGAPPSEWVDLRDRVDDGVLFLGQGDLDAVAGGPLPQGPHTLHFRAVDPRGNASTAELSFTYDTVAPLLKLDSPPRGLKTTNITVTGRATDSGDGAGDGTEVVFEVDADDTDSEDPDPDTGAFAYATDFATDGSDDGPHSVRVSAVDLAGNSSPAHDISFHLLSRALTAVPGPAAEPAHAHLPAMAVPFPPAGDVTLDARPGGTGLPTSRTRIAVQFAPAATVADANAAIDALDALVVGTVRDARVTVLSIPDSGDFAALDAAIATLDANPAVATAAQDVELGVTSLPGPTDAADPHLRGPPNYNTPAGRVPNPWLWNYLPSNGAAGGAAATGADGNWGLEAVRAPQMWNLNTAAARAPGVPRTGVLDAGFNDANGDGIEDHPHRDVSGLQLWNFARLPFGLLASQRGATPHFHGAHVAGIIGAGFHNGAGVAGINPFAESHGAADGHFVGVSIGRANTPVWTTILADLSGMLNAWDFDVVNLSLGFNWQPQGIDANVDAGVQARARRRGLQARALATAHPDTILVAAAGNDSFNLPGHPQELDAQWASPFTWAALGATVGAVGPVPNVLVVESTDAVVANAGSPSYQWTYTKSDFSNVNGTISAPGGRILSTVGSNLTAVLPNPWTNYHTDSGTSMAAPHVTGLIGYLLKLDPDLTPTQLTQLLTGALFTRTTVPSAADAARLPNGVAGSAAMVDAFAAALGIDLVTGDPLKPVQLALVDVDDGTRDGNLRLDPVGGGNVDTVAHADRRRGDGRATMRDFRAWRDAYLQVVPDLGFGGTLAVTLDGPANHFKKDLNFDGAINGGPVGSPHPEGIPQANSFAANAPTEDVYPRYDFNGDGRIGEWFATAPFQIDPDSPLPTPRNDTSSTLRTGPGFLRDLDVLADPAIWNPTEADGASENVTTTSALAGQSAAGAGPFDTWAYLLSNIDQANPAVPTSLQLHPDYLHSFDAHLDIDWGRLDPAIDLVYVTVRSKVHGADIADGWTRSFRIERGRGTTEVSIPLWTGDVTFELAGVDLQDPSLPPDLGDLPGHTIEWSGLTFGQDKALKLPFYRLIDLGRLGEGTLEEDYWSEAVAVNNRGQVVGDSSTSFLDKGGASIEHAFFWEDVNGNGVSDPGEMTDMVPGGANHVGRAADINDAGEAIGTWWGEDSLYEELFVRRPDGSLAGLGFGGHPGAINNAGVIVGTTRAVDATPARAFRLGPGGLEIIPQPFGAPDGINEHGHMVGVMSTGEVGQTVGLRAFVSRAGDEMTPLVSPINPLTGQPHTWNSYAIDINDAGWIAGYYWSVWGFRTVVWSPVGEVSDIGGAASQNTYPRAINDGGTIVGYADPHPTNLRDYAYLAHTGGGMIDLNTVLPPNTGWHLLEANDINDRGEIVGQALVNNREYRAYLLTTVPAPAGRGPAAAAAASPPAPPERSTPGTRAPPRRTGYLAAAAIAGDPPVAPAASAHATTPDAGGAEPATTLLRRRAAGAETGLLG